MAKTAQALSRPMFFKDTEAAKPMKPWNETPEPKEAEVGSSRMKVSFYLSRSDCQRLKHLATQRGQMRQEWLMDAVDAYLEAAGEEPLERWETMSPA